MHIPTKQFDTIDIILPENVIKYKGKVRNVYIRGHQFVSVATDRISAFDHVLLRTIPFKGQVLNQIAAHFLDEVKDIVPVWLDNCPHPNVSVGKNCMPIRLEMVIRGYLSGHAWREYRSGNRQICGIEMPKGMIENDPFPEPIITPTSKADIGHDIDVSRIEILANEIVTEDVLNQLEDYTRALFKRGQEIALQRGLILVDTKYEFGMFDDKIFLMDEIHTPDSSRYFYAESYFDNQLRGNKQNQLSKEFVREWLITNDFQGLEGQSLPAMSDELTTEISERYIHLYELITGIKFIPADYDTLEADINSEVQKVFS
ncbi:MAG TPA: phosphoribosylaminoimidazolesuccinocarboxamide synthase [Saprospiraceae bacterium]|nr:phosphoribosylaminoimidazolesuccinocarboxamide synthase [Saprospiraceae bacterium]HQW55986.1 phosphoribosylaminoimidazolesuccinocarboxamide synthase [Saprospiraceae bacterium]